MLAAKPKFDANRSSAISADAKPQSGYSATMSDEITVPDLMADPKRLVREMQAGRVIHFADVDYIVAPTSAVPFVDYSDDDEAADMASFRKDVTGVDNTVFVSTKGRARHAARIKIAIDPPDSLNAASASASMAIHDFSVIGAYVPPHIVEQAKQFIGRNRETLLAFWNCEIDTLELTRRLKPPPSQG